MANTLRIKRRASGGSGAPSSLANAELAFNEVDDTLYYGKGTGGAGGTATTVEAIGGIGAFVGLSGTQTITGNKTFSGTVALGSSATATTQSASDNSTKVATTAYVDSAVSSAGGGTVSSVALTAPSFLSVSGSPITTSGTIALSLASQTANYVFAAPNGSSGAPTFRALVSADIPDLSGTYLPLTGGTISSNLTISGNLTVNGTTTNINSTNLVVEDKNIVLGDVASPSDTTADGGGITLKGATDKTFNWVDATDAWTSSEHLNLLTGKAFYINGSSVLSSTTLGSGVTGSSLTSVGTIGTGTWQGTVVGVSYGGTGANNAGTARTNLGLAIGTDVQAYDAGLASIAGLTTVADRMIYTTASDTYAVTTLTSAGRAILDDVDASAQRTTLGLGTIATQNANNVSISGGSVTNLTTFDGITIDGGTF
jgi:hypothetical protein